MWRLVLAYPSSWVVGQTVEGPTQFFTQLGIAGVVAGVVFLWQRDTAKQRDRERDLNIAANEGLVPVLHEVLATLRRSNEAHQAGTEAAKQLSEAIKSLPESQVWVRLEGALERLERFERGAGG
jgi:hypothetical protein